MLFLKKSFLGAAAALVLLFLSAPALHAANKFEKEVTTEKIAVKLAREVVKGDYNLITARELKDLMDSKTEMILVDTGPYDGGYVKAHLPGAKQFQFPAKEMLTWDPQETGSKSQQDYLRLLGTDKQIMIVVYCGFVKCGRSHNGAMWAKQIGYSNVYRFPGGLYAWRGAGYSTAKTK